MKLEQLQQLIEIANSPSINTASEKIHISHQALSRSMQSLEEELGITLLKRTNKGTTLTESGIEIVALSKQFLQGIKNIKNAAVTSPKEDICGTINLITTDMCYEFFLFDFITEVKTIYPNIKFDCQIIYSQEKIYLFLHQDTNRIAIHFFGSPISYAANYPADIQIQKLYQSIRYVICSPMHKLTSYKAVSWETLRNYKLLMRGPDSLEMLNTEIFPKDNVFFEPNPVIFQRKIAFDNYFTFGFKIPFAPHIIPPIEHSKAIPLTNNNQVDLVMLYHENFSLTVENEIFISLLRNKLKGMQIKS